MLSQHVGYLKLSFQLHVNMLRKINNMKQQSNKQSQCHLVTLLSQVFVLYFIFVLRSDIGLLRRVDKRNSTIHSRNDIRNNL